MKKLVFFLAALLMCAVFTEASRAASISNDECLGCHSEKGMTKTRGGVKISLYVEKEVFTRSAHKNFECVKCHANITEIPHAATLKAPDCAGCHKQEAEMFQGCIHQISKNSPLKPSCQGCHGTHDIKNHDKIPTFVCQKCHVKVFEEYKNSVHGEKTVNGKGVGEIATCFDCHGVHKIYKKDDPRSPVYHLNLPKTCAKCHSDEKLVKKYGLHHPNVYKLYMDSIHGRAVSKSGLLVSANCYDCHGSHAILRKEKPNSTINRKNIAKMCGHCHMGVLDKYSQSIHGRKFAMGATNAPTCTDCHKAHEASRVTGADWMLEAIRECGTCHEKYITTYRDSYHGKVTTLGYVRVAKCSDCHGSHEIQEQKDPRSLISKENIVKTCGSCHPGANEKFTKYIAHSNYHDKRENPVLYYTYKIMTGLLLGTFGFFGLHALLWLPRSWVERFQARRRKEEKEGGK